MNLMAETTGIGTELVTSFGTWVTSMTGDAKVIMLGVVVGGLTIFGIKFLPVLGKKIFTKMAG